MVIDLQMDQIINAEGDLSAFIFCCIEQAKLFQSPWKFAYEVILTTSH